ncbi:MAG: sugar-binding domain-containing protein [Acidobacteriaceae bacterium]
MMKSLLRVATLALGPWILAATSASANVYPMHSGWQARSGCKIADPGSIISNSSFNSAGWVATTVPTTVVAAQVAAGEFKDPYFGMNLRSIPGTTYPVGMNFSNLPMPADSPYRCGWWFRREFSVPAEGGKNVSLQFDGINYTGEIWVNGTKVADQQQVVGAYRRYEFDITKWAKRGARNVIAVKTFAPPEQALAINWVDWNPMPPDKDMGLWGEVRFLMHGAVVVRHPSVFTHFTDASLKTAMLAVTADLTNYSEKPVEGLLSGTVAGVPISMRVAIEAGQTKAVTITSQQVPRLAIHHPRVWWPAEYGAQPLETLTLKFSVGGAVSDEQTASFGIREVTSELDSQGHRLYTINGQRILIRGGGWSQDMLLRESHERLVRQFALVRDLHLNTIRLEGKLETEDFFNLADRNGIMVMAGWCCCDFWEHWKDWKPGDLDIAAASLQSQILRLRGHPSLLVWLDGSDNPPPAEVEQRYLAVLKEAQWPNPILSSASAAPTTVTGQSGVKMSGPYDFVAPSYWYQDTNKRGGAFGFNTETSPGPAVPSVAELSRFLPQNALWPPDNPMWNYHAGGGGFKNLGVFNAAMTNTYGPAEDIKSYVRLAEAMEYDGERSMFEAYSGNRYTSTGLIQWMLNNAWPSLIWHLYDYSLVPGAGYYGAKKANQPVHAQYNYGDQGIYVVNSTLKSSPPLAIKVEVFDLALHLKFSKTVEAVGMPNSSQRLFTIPEGAVSDKSQLHFIRISTTPKGAAASSTNFYWVPQKLTEFDWAKTEYNVTPALIPEVMTDLRKLPAATVRVTFSRQQGSGIVVATLQNTSEALAFQVHAQVLDAEKHEAPMVMWDDNYLELMPGERRVIRTTATEAALKGRLTIKVSGWNIPPVEHAISLTSAKEH